jgi:lipoprotein signal peptidase
MIHVSRRDAASLFATQRAPIAALGATAAAVIVVDEISKVLARYLLPELERAPTRFIELGVVHNVDATAALSAVAVLVILGLSLVACGALALHDRAAPVMLGLIAGAGVANATDALTPPAGVVDWIAVGAGGGIVVNLADMAVLAGVCLCGRTVCRLLAEVRRERSAHGAGPPRTTWEAARSLAYTPLNRVTSLRSRLSSGISRGR